MAALDTKQDKRGVGPATDERYAERQSSSNGDSLDRQLHLLCSTSLGRATFLSPVNGQFTRYGIVIILCLFYLGTLTFQPCSASVSDQWP